MRRDEISGVVSLHFFQHSVFFAEHGECAQPIERLLFPNFAHSKSDLHKHPVAAAWGIVLQQSGIYMPTHADYFTNARADSSLDSSIIWLGWPGTYMEPC